GGRSMAAMLPKLFFVHFRDTSFVAEEDGRVVAFLCGFRSQTHDDEAYIHFVAVAPRTTVRAVTSPANERSVAFHRALGFEVERVDEEYDGRGEARVLLT